MKIIAAAVTIAALYIVGVPAFASVVNTCLLDATNTTDIEAALDRVDAMSSFQLKNLIHACAVDHYPAGGKYASSVSLCATLAPVEKIEAGHIYLLGAIAKSAPVARPYAELISEDGTITLTEKNSLCRLIEKGEEASQFLLEHPTE